MPRSIYYPLFNALLLLVAACEQIAIDIRRGARSGRPIYHEPFGRNQMGSSAMPGKRNPVKSENEEGMFELMRGCQVSLTGTLVTEEERAIAQSSIERVAWEDAFHIALYSVKQIMFVLKGLQVMPSNMLDEIEHTGGSYAAGAAAGVLKLLGVNHGLSAEEAYRVIQLAAFIVYDSRRPASIPIPQSLEEACTALRNIDNTRSTPLTLFSVLVNGTLVVNSGLAATQEDVDCWNATLQKMFEGDEQQLVLREAFDLEAILGEEEHLINKLLTHAPGTIAG